MQTCMVPVLLAPATRKHAGHAAPPRMENTHMLRKSIRASIVMILFVIAVTLSGCGITFAWFTDKSEVEDDLHGATGGVEIYAQGSLVASDEQTAESPISITLQSSVESPHHIIEIKNTSTVEMLVRVNFVRTLGDASDEAVDEEIINFNIDNEKWKTQDDGFGYPTTYFYNERVAAGSTIVFIPNITVSDDSYNGQTLSISLIVDVLAYDGNAYQTGNGDLPWGDISDIPGWTAWQ